MTSIHDSSTYRLLRAAGRYTPHVMQANLFGTLFPGWTAKELFRSFSTGAVGGEYPLWEFVLEVGSDNVFGQFVELVS